MRIEKSLLSEYKDCKIYKSTYGPFVRLDYDHGRGGKEMTIRFLRTGYTRKASISTMSTGEVKDFLVPSVAGVGYPGEKFLKIKAENRELMQVLRSRWKNMIERCYDSKSPNYYEYGGKGVTVCDRWKNFSNYYYDVQKLPGYDEELMYARKIFLDKDKNQIDIPIGKRVYSPEYCQWLTAEENCEFSSAPIKIKTTYPDGHEEVSTGLRKLADKLKIPPTSLSDALRSETGEYSGYIFRYA